MAVNKTENINEYHLNRNQPEKPQFVIYDMNQYLKKNQANTTRPHIHSYYQIIWFKSGTGKHFVDFKEYDVFENAIFFIAKNQVHYFDANIDYTGDSNLNVSQIGYRLGSDDPSYFVKYFKKHTTISPTDFRKSIA